MPELPDILLYLSSLEPRVLGHRLERIRLASPFLLRSVDPPLEEAHGKHVRELRRLGKRIVFALDDELFLILHLMIAGRLRWTEKDEASDAAAGLRAPGRGRGRGAGMPGGRIGLATFEFSSGMLLLTEAGSKKRASLHLARGEEALRRHDPGGLDVFTASLAEFREALARENHTLKRALTDPRLFSGIGNAYSDEILHAARLSPLKLTRRLTAGETERLFERTKATLAGWTDRLRAETGARFPVKVTAFRPGMAVHGRFRQPCPDCGAPVQRIVYAENEANYCARCQTGGKVLADRSLSRLLKADWPATLEEWERR